MNRPVFSYSDEQRICEFIQMLNGDVPVLAVAFLRGPAMDTASLECTVNSIVTAWFRRQLPKQQEGEPTGILDKKSRHTSVDQPFRADISRTGGGGASGVRDSHRLRPRPVIQAGVSR
jgi:hypothetical protein